MTTLTEEERTYLLERLLGRAIPWLLHQQLPTGEFVTYREHGGQSLPYSCPLLSALALDALDCLDANSDHFHERLFDLIAAPDRASVRVAVSTLRWRLRMHLAAQQEADGTWRRFGRGGNSPRCRTTSGFALLMYLSQTLQPQRESNRILEQTSETAQESAAGAVFAQRLQSLEGHASEKLAAQTLTLMEQEKNPMLALWAAAQACYEGALTCDLTRRASMLRLALQQRDSRQSFRTHHDKVFGLTVLRVCHDGSPAAEDALERALTELLLDPQPPALWPREPIAFGVSSAAVTLSLMLRSLAQAILAPCAAEVVLC